MRDLRFVEARPEDLPVLADMVFSLFQGEPDFTPDRDVQYRGLELILKNPDLARIFVARDPQGLVAGMVNLQFSISTAMGAKVGILEDVIVREDLRGRGIGTWLFSRLLDWCREQGIPRITLLTESANLGAQKFYAAQGFQKSTMVVLRRWEEGTAEPG